MPKTITHKFFSYLLIAVGVVGFLASLILAFEKYKIALDPSYLPSCSLNPILSCGEILTSGTDRLLLGIPNAFFGIGAFSALAAIGVAMLAGAQFKKWFWQLFYAMAVVGMASVIYFLSQSLLVIGTLCIYCMTTWAVTTALFTYSTIYLTQEKILTVPKFMKKLWPSIAKNHVGVVLVIYLVIFALILFRFRDYFESVWL